MFTDDEIQADYRTTIVERTRQMIAPDDRDGVWRTHEHLALRELIQSITQSRRLDRRRHTRRERV